MIDSSGAEAVDVARVARRHAIEERDTQPAYVTVLAFWAAAVFRLATY